MKKLIFIVIVCLSVFVSVCAQTASYNEIAPKVPVQIQGKTYYVQDVFSTNLVSDIRKSAYAYAFSYKNRGHFGDWAITYQYDENTYGIVYGDNGIIFNRQGVIAEGGDIPWGQVEGSDSWAEWCSPLMADSTKRVRYAYAYDSEGRYHNIIVFGK